MLYANYIAILKREEKTKAAEHSMHGGESHSVAQQSNISWKSINYSEDSYKSHGT